VLEINLEEVPDWLCCGATPAHITSHLLSVALPVSNCTWAGKEKLDLVTTCAFCFHRTKVANLEVRNDEKMRNKVEEVLGEKYDGGVDVLHILEVLKNDVGFENIKAKIKRPLKGLKVVNYYGCLLTRLPEGVRIDKVENPTMMEDLTETLGAEPVDWSAKTECCGGSMAVTHKKTVLRLANELLTLAKNTGADCISVACPMCQSNLDLCQGATERKYKTKFDIPVLYFTQLMGLAFGLNAKQVGLEKLIVDPRPLLERKGFLEKVEGGS
jgi:heterodisulfide reductase subunit B